MAPRYAWATTRIDYLATQISYRLVKGTFLDDVQKHSNQLKKAVTEMRNEDANATANRDIFAQELSRGTAQSSRWTSRISNVKTEPLKNLVAVGAAPSKRHQNRRT